MAGPCQLKIEAPDELAVSLIVVDLERRGLLAVPNGSRTLTVNVADRPTADQLVGEIGAIAHGSRITIDGASTGAANATAAPAHAPTAYAIVVAPTEEHRHKWDSSLKRVEMQVGRDSGRPVERGGSNFAARGFATLEDADRAAAAIANGIRTKRNMEPAVLVVPDDSAPLLLNVEADKRDLIRQLGYGVDSTCLVQIQVGDPAARATLRERFETIGVKVAETDGRLLLGFPNKQDAKVVVDAAKPPPGAALQVTKVMLDMSVLERQLRTMRTRSPAGDPGWVDNWRDVTGFGGLGP